MPENAVGTGPTVPNSRFWRSRDGKTIHRSSKRRGYAPASGAWEGSQMPSDTLALMPLDDQTTRELSRAAAHVRTWTEKRNTLIRQAFEAGAGIREIAKATGLNVGTVHTMLHGRKR